MTLYVTCLAKFLYIKHTQLKPIFMCTHVVLHYLCFRKANAQLCLIHENTSCIISIMH